MLSFECDYTTGAHPAIIKRLKETNEEPQPGYGCDAYSQSAADKIRTACHATEADVFFLSGGTQTNAIVISSLLRGYQGVIAADTGHISVHEAGAIEASGHKVLTIPPVDGKLIPQTLSTYLQRFYDDANHDHMVFPGMVYLSHPTEYGTLYTLAELTAISDICKKYALPLFLDGARLGYGLMSYDTDVTLPDIARLCDVFYIGGTKVGALCGEAVVFPHKAPAHFMTHVKQRGALLAKGRLLGLQFDTLFTDDLYFTISRHAIDMAIRLKKMLLDKGYQLAIDSPTNQQFVIMENSKLAALSQQVRYSFWERYDDTHTVIRLATSWATRAEDLDALEELL